MYIIMHHLMDLVMDLVIDLVMDLITGLAMDFVTNLVTNLCMDPAMDFDLDHAMDHGSQHGSRSGRHFHGSARREDGYDVMAGPRRAQKKRESSRRRDEIQTIRRLKSGAELDNDRVGPTNVAGRKRMIFPDRAPVGILPGPDQ